MNGTQTLIDTNLMAMLVMAGVSFLGLVFTIISFWVRFNVKIKEIELEQNNLMLSNSTLEKRIFLLEKGQRNVENQHNEMLTSYALINERQQEMKKALDRIIDLLEARQS